MHARNNAVTFQRPEDVTSAEKRDIGRESVQLDLLSATIAKSLGIWHETALPQELSAQKEVAEVGDVELATIAETKDI